MFREVDVRIFPPFRLDVGNERLWKDDHELKLRRKPFAILRYLTLHPRRLVTQEELVEAVWGRIAMSESLLRTHMADLRRVLGEDVVETVVGRGYRFLLDVESERAAHVARAQVATSMLVGRDRETAVLQEAFERVLGKRRQLVFLLGEPGIGKTALADDFVDRVAQPHGALIARGVCVEQIGAGEAYLPILDALGALCRGPDGTTVVALMKRYAPTWVVQLPSLVSDAELQSVLLRIQGATQARMLRELAEVLDMLAVESPVVLVIEDMQWSDPSTMDLIAMLGARREAARVFVLATCRPSDLAHGHGLAKAIAQLGAHKQAINLELESWSDVCVGEYLAHRFENAVLPPDLPRTIRRMTAGNPLFVTAVVDDLQTRETIKRVDGEWKLATDAAHVEHHLPDSVRSLIDGQIDRRKSEEQRILEAASIVGLDFTVAAVAFALDLPADVIDSACEGLANDGRFLQFVATERWPDGTLQSHYAFVHGLYRDAARARVPAGTRRVFHRKVAEGLEASHRNNLEEISAELALHFDEAQAFGPAVTYHSMAGERAIKRFGRAESLAHFNRARALLSRLPVSDESELIELRVLKHVGPTLIALRGFQDVDLQQTLERTFHLARKLGDDRAALAGLLGLQRFHVLQGHLRSVEKYEADVAAVVARIGDPIASAEAAVVAYSARLHRGQLDVARGPLTSACKVLDAAGTDPSRSVNAPVVGLWGTHMVILEWVSGAPDEAVAVATRMLTRATSLGDPLHLSAAFAVAGLAHRLRREPQRTFDLAQQALEASRQASSPLWEGRAKSLYHWAATLLDPASASAHCDEILSVMGPLLEVGPYSRPAIALSVVEVCIKAGRNAEAMREIDDTLAYIETSDERVWESELHRLRGDLLLDKHMAAARLAFQKALDVAQGQGAKAFELRAALSLARCGGASELEALEKIYATFREGLDTADLSEANAFITKKKGSS